MAEVKDYVMNVESKDKLQSTVDRNKIEANFNFDKFDQEMEAHFNDFLESHKKEFTKDTSKNTIKAAFNEWLDNELIKIDDFKNKLIEVAIIAPTSFELQHFETVSELGIFQERIIAEKDNTRQSEIVSVRGDELHINTFKDESGEKVNPNRIAELFNENFEKREELLDLLKKGKIDDVKKFQRIVAGLDEDGSEDDTKGKKGLLGSFGVDGKFGGNTMKTFEKYIKDAKIDSAPAQQDSTEGNRSETTDTTVNNPLSADQVDNSEERVSASGESVGAEIPVEPKGKPVRFETSSDSQEINPDTVTELTVEQAKAFVEKNKNEQTIHLRDLKKIDKAVAAELAKFAGEIYFSSLEEVDEDVLNEFAGGNCTMVSFPSGAILTKEDDGVKIIIKDGATYTVEQITSDVLAKLGKGRVSGSGDAPVSGGSGGSTTTTAKKDDKKQSGNKNGGSISSTSTTVTTTTTTTQQSGQTGGVAQQTSGNQSGGENGRTSDVQQQYEGVGYNIDNPESTREASTDEEAIQFLTKGSGRGVFFIARLFGKKKHNTELSIVDANYEPTGQEKTDLNNLNKYLLECKDNPTEVFTKIFRQNKDFGDNENLGKLYDLYRECRNDQNGTNKGAYLKKVMGLLENYFVRGVKGKNGQTITTFKDMYNNELLGVKKDLEDREKRAKKALDDSEQTQLQETGGTALEAVNTKTQLALPSEKFAEFKEKYGFDSNAETQFAMCLCDLNADGRIDSRDMSAKTGQELFNLIRDAKVDQKYGILEKGPMYNILNFAKIKAEQDGHANTAEFLKGINLNGTDEEIMNKLKERPLTIQYLRYMLINSPMNMANNIIRYGGVKIETGNTADDLILDKETREAINKIMSDERFEEIYGNAYQQLVDQGLNDTPEIRKKARPIIALALFESSGSFMGGASGGFDFSLGKAGDIAFMLGAGVGPDGNIMAGISVAYGKSRALGKRKGSIISVGVSGGFNVAEGQFVPMVIGSLGFDQMINGPKLEKTLEERSAKFLGIDGNVGVIGGIPVRGVGLSFSQDKMKGLNITYESIKSDLGNTLKESLKDQRPNSTDKTEIRTQMIASIKTALESRYGRTKEQELDQAAQNIFGGISYYLTEIENPSQITEEQKTAIIEKVAENYANQWRNKAMSELNGTTELERVRIGVEFLAGYWPIPMASISIKKYGNLTANETVESMENYYQRLSSGIGMEYIDNSVSTEGNDKGYLTAATITYLNSKLSVLSPSGDVPPIKKIINGDKYDLQIPRNLCKYANISYNPELESYMKYDESSDSFMVPANIKMGLLTYSRTNDGKYNLILGDFKKGDGFKDLDLNSKPEGDTTKYEGKEGDLKITDLVINNNAEMKELFANSEFPLSQCVESKNGKVYFKEKVGFEIAIERGGKLGFPQNGILSAPEYGMLQITKTTEDKYIATFDDSIKDKLTIKYVDVKKVNEYIANSKQELGLEDTFDQYEGLNSMFDKIEKRLSRLDDSQWGAYANFMDYASTMIDNVLNESSYENAFKELNKMLNTLSTSDLTNTDLKALKDLIDTGNLSNVEKTLIVDRFKMIFSYHIDLTNGKNDYDDLNKTIKGGQGGRYGRGNVYETLKGYNGEPIPESLHGYRDKILDKLKGQAELQKQPRPNLIGMTAFYRYNKDGRRIKEGRGYSMTEMGRTTVLGGAYEELTDDASRNRFISNLKKSEAHKSILSEAITKKIHSVPGLEGITINSDQVTTLLEGKELDISGKKFTIEMKYMFYLLGECGNESIGANLEKIIIKGIGGGGGGETGTTTVEIGSETSYRDAAGLSIDGVAAENSLNIGTTRSQTYGIAVGNTKPTGHTHDDTGVENIHPDSTGPENIHNESTGERVAPGTAAYTSGIINSKE